MAPRSQVEVFDVSNSTKAYFAPATATRGDARLLHISGQTGSALHGHTPDDYESQIHLALWNLRKIIVAAGATTADIAKLTVYIVNYDVSRRKHARHIQRFLGGHRPAMTLVPIPKLAFPEWLIEVEAVVVVPTQAAAPPISRSLSSRVRLSNTADVIIIGAGLAGLAAAHELLRAGLTSIILEARDRVGGKTLSHPFPDGKGVIEKGAAWINDVNQTKMTALARRFGLELIEQNTTGHVAFQGLDGAVSKFVYGDLPEFDVASKQDVARVRDKVEEDCQMLDVFQPRSTELDSMTFEAYIRSLGATEAALWTATVWTRAMVGLDPGDVSALFFLNYCKSGGGLLQMRSDRKGGGQHLRVRKGTQSFSTGLASLLPEGTVLLNRPVQCVSHQGDASGPAVEVTAADGTRYAARKLITTVPSPVLKTLEFTPKLHPVKLAWSEAAGYGTYSKAMMVFKSPFWIPKGFCGLAQSFIGPAAVIRDSCSPPDNKYVLTCFMSGPPADEWNALPVKQQEATLLAQIGKLFEFPHVDKEFVEMVHYLWAGDEWSGYGCPCASLGPGVLDTLGADALRQPAGNLHFAGTETAGEWKGYMEGAVRSGERAAVEIVRALKTSVAARL